MFARGDPAARSAQTMSQCSPEAIGDTRFRTPQLDIVKIVKRSGVTLPKANGKGPKPSQ